MALMDELVKLATEPSTYGVGGGVLALGYFVFRELARRFSRDKVEVAKDRAETNVIELLQEQLDKAIDRAERAEAARQEAFAQVHALNKQLAEVESSLKILQVEIIRLRAEVKVLRENNAITGRGSPGDNA
jgi:chromosome segregation ATPase